MQDSVHVKGLAELQRFLDTLPVNIERNIMRGALRQGAQIVMANAKSRIHSVSGGLAAGIATSVSARGGKVTARIVAGDANKPNLPIWLEYGTRPHLIKVQESEKPINAKASARAGHIVRASMTTINRNVLRIGNRFVGPTVSHPGARRRPFMRPALDTTAGAVLAAVGNYIKHRLTKQGLKSSTDLFVEDK